MRQLAKILILSLVLQVFLPAATLAETHDNQLTSEVVISEVVTGTEAGASAEFVELYNTTDQVVDLGGWELDYKSASGSNWSDKVDEETDQQAGLVGQIAPRGFWTIASEDFQALYPEFNCGAALSSGLAAGGGHLRLQQVSEDPETEPVVQDIVSWGDAETEDSALNAPAPDNELSQSLKRQFDNDGQIMVSGDLSDDFVLSSEFYPQTTPLSDNQDSDNSNGEENPDEEDPEEETEDPGQNPSDQEPEQYRDLVINELMPDPAQPQTDAEDEFVELYNPHNNSVNLAGYRIQTGSNLQSDFIIKNRTIKAGGFASFYASDGQLSLTNSGGRVQLLDPGNGQASQTVKYPEAETGQTWAKLGSSYQWTNQSTPGSKNRLSQVSETTDSTRSSGVNSSSSSSVRATYPPIKITELMPDPASPQTDAEDEFVELYNPNDFPVQLKDYQLLTGGDLDTSHDLSDTTIEANSYAVFFADSATISLVNSGGTAELAGADGTKISVAKPYPEAEEGASWALVGGEWQWTNQPTPNAKNELKSLDTGEGDSDSSERGDFTAGGSNPAATPGVIGTQDNANHFVWVASVAALAYVLFEFRFDLINFYRRVRQRFHA